MDTIALLPSRVQTTELPAAAPVTAEAFAFADAELSAKQARQDFADAKAKLGAKTALAEFFNPRVLRQIQVCTNRALARVLYVVGMAMSGETHSWPISVNGKVRDGRDRKEGDAWPAPGTVRLVEGQLLDRYHKTYPGRKMISYKQFCRLLDKAAELGLITRTHQNPEGPDGEHPNAFQPDIIEVHFWKVLKDGVVVPHDFNAPLGGLAGSSGESHQQQNVHANVHTNVHANVHLSYVPNESSCPLGQPKIKASPPEKKRPPAKTQELGACVQQCGRPAEYQGPAASQVICGQCRDKLPEKTRQLFHRPGEEPARSGPENDHDDNQPEYSNRFWVYQGGKLDRQFWPEDNPQHEPFDTSQVAKVVQLTVAEAVYVFRTLKKYRHFQQNFMAHKAYGEQLLPGMPKMQAIRARRQRRSR